MPDEIPEILKNIEEKKTEDEAVDHSVKLLSMEKVMEIVASRYKKLEKIKADIPLKTYDLVLKKLQKEEDEIKNRLTKKSAEVAKENRPQALPKAFFEERKMKVRIIRID